MFTSYQLKLDWTQDLPKYWCDKSPFKTHFFNALSITFPDGEKFYVNSVRHYKDSITDEQLKDEVKEFIKQENWHSHIHQQYNNWTESLGLPVNKLRQEVIDLISYTDNLSPKTRLAITVCQEHITVILASAGLRNRTLYRTMHPHFENVWRWHNIEEIEHKSVSMDVWLDQYNTSMNSIMILSTIVFWYKIFSLTVQLLHADKQLWKWRTFKDSYNMLFAKTGLFRLGYKRWLEFFKKDFHPDNHNDTILLNYRKG